MGTRVCRRELLLRLPRHAAAQLELALAAGAQGVMGREPQHDCRCQLVARLVANDRRRDPCPRTLALRAAELLPRPRAVGETPLSGPPAERPRRWILCPELTRTAVGKWVRKRWVDWLKLKRSN